MTYAPASVCVSVMIIADIDIYRAAKIYLDKHDKDATSEALKKSAELLTKGDIKGGETWHKIAFACAWMLNEDFGEGMVIQ